MKSLLPSVVPIAAGAFLGAIWLVGGHTSSRSS